MYVCIKNCRIINFPIIIFKLLNCKLFSKEVKIILLSIVLYNDFHTNNAH